MYDLNVVPKSLKTFCTNKQSFKDSGDSLEKLWNDIIKNNNIENDDDLIKEYYDHEFDKLDILSRDMLLSMIATTVTNHEGWPLISEGPVYFDNFMNDYTNSMITHYGFEKSE